MHTILDARNLCEAEQNLIRAAVGNQGVLEIATGTATRGRAVFAGRTKFFDPRDRSVAEQHLSLLSRLIELALFREVSNKNAYELTNVGWQLSRTLGR
jgi:hypothetical protein